MNKLLERRLSDHAIKQKLLLVKLSPRKYQVILVDFTCDGYWFDFTTSQYFTNLHGQVVFSGSFAKCRAYIAQDSQPVTNIVKEQL